MSDPIDGLKLYRVELTQTIYVLAKSELDAILDGPSFARDDMAEPDVDAAEVKAFDCLSDDVRGSIPHWGKVEDPPTVAEVLEILKARSVST